MRKYWDITFWDQYKQSEQGNIEVLWNNKEHIRKGQDHLFKTLSFILFLVTIRKNMFNSIPSVMTC